MCSPSASTSTVAGISLAAFVAAVAASLAYYQLAYVPEATARPQLPKHVLEPEESVEITIVQGASLAENNNKQAYAPGNARGVYGISNKIIWTNTDAVMHTVTSDDGYDDRISGRFDSVAQMGSRLIGQGETFTFTFTKTGEYPYHCEPHPHMQGRVEIVENYS